MRERDALVRSLRKEGRRDEAEEVRALAKPSVVAWSVNQLAHHRRKELDRLLEAADALRQAQVSGSDDFAAAAAAERVAVRALTRAAGAILAEEGRPATDATLDRVAQTLRAAAADDEARGLLERGLLTREVEATGFGTLLGSLPAAPPSRAKPKTEARERAKERARAEKEVERARARADDLERRATSAEEAAADARRAAADAAADLAESERRLRDLAAP